MVGTGASSDSQTVGKDERMIEAIETYEDGLLVNRIEVEVPDLGPAAQVGDIAQALAALPPDTLAALREALGL